MSCAAAPAHPDRPSGAASRQQGSATLLIGLLLLVGAGILTFSATRTGVIEQRIAGNEARSIEAQQAAQAGLEYGLAWLRGRRWSEDGSQPQPPQTEASSGYVYDTRLTVAKNPYGICLSAQATAASEPGVTATAHDCIEQTGLFDGSPSTVMPPPLTLAGCLNTPAQDSSIAVRNGESISILTGDEASSRCLPQGNLSASAWTDDNANRVMDAIEQGESLPIRRASFIGCPAAGCVWNQVFDMSLDQATQIAVAAHHEFTDRIPCGAVGPPGVYIIRSGGTIDAMSMSGQCIGTPGVNNRTIGAPDSPVLLIVPESSGCPSFSKDISIYGIVYYASPTACEHSGWGGASIHGAVLWEGSAGQIGAGSRFIEADYGSGSMLNDAFQVITHAARIPGTWRDWDAPP